MALEINSKCLLQFFPNFVCSESLWNFLKMKCSGAEGFNLSACLGITILVKYVQCRYILNIECLITKISTCKTAIFISVLSAYISKSPVH